MEANSAIFMLDNTNVLFRHGIPHTLQEFNRYSLTFRRNLEGTLPYIENFDDLPKMQNNKPLIYYPDGSTNIPITEDTFDNSDSLDPDWNNVTPHWHD